MSDPRIALIAEGTTDLIVIEAALKAILQRDFILSQLQPEPTRPSMGQGWGGVFKWCQEFRNRGYMSIESDPTLQGFDLVIVHLDADVADKTYAECGPAAEQAGQRLQPIPSSRPCPPAADTVIELETLLLNWLGIAGLGPKSVFCIPSKSTEAWLAAAVLPQSHALLTGIECNVGLAANLSQLPLNQRVRKSGRNYRELAPKVTSEWQQTKHHCRQARLFEQRTVVVIQTFPS